MGGNPGSYFGKQVKKERIARGWGLDEMAKVTGISVSLWSRIENGKRPPTKASAAACDAAFAERKGWFTEYYFELQTWAETPSWLKPWAEHEMSAKTLRSWSPVVVPGLLQTAVYAGAQMSQSPGITAERLAERVANRIARQKRVLYRDDDPPLAHFLVDITSLRRMPAHVMGGQLRHLLEAAQLPNITIQVVPECWHAGMSGGFVLTDTAAYAESVTTGQIYGGDDETVSALARRFDTLRTEAMRASESLVLIREMIQRERLAKVDLLKRQRRRVRGGGLG
jgi:transcriptional regulator with XRE-family HTH domain